MHYLSTRDAALRFSASQAIAQGLSRDGGLFLPSEIPQLSREDLQALCAMDYPHRAADIMKRFLEEFTLEELLSYAKAAYSTAKFDTPLVAPLEKVGERYVLELFHGPTCAFKDMALQMLPYLLTASLQKLGEQKTACILVATSGDTGKAALEGFRDVAHTKILVFYPQDGVSDIQKLQMVTQSGENVGVCAVKGNFDDAQTGVKKIFSDPEIRKTLEEKNCFFSSANSINWGRLLPQIVYYVSAYCDLLSRGAIRLGDTVDVCVPTGNFGNILAAYYAKRMGVPLGKLICASNRNKVLTDFIQTGTYDRNRPFYTTTSPSMDILISSNLERLLYLLTDSDSAVRAYMRALSETGKYTVSADLLEKIHESFTCGFANEAETARTIKAVFEKHRYLLDTHTAVAWSVAEQYQASTQSENPCIVASTASAYKFCASVLTALGETALRSGTDVIAQLSERTATPAPQPLAALAGKPVRFTGCTEKENMASAVMELLR